MCDNNCTKNCQNKRKNRCKALNTLARLNMAEESDKARNNRFSYNTGFIAQLMSQQKDTSSETRRNRKNPLAAINAYQENQAVIAGDHLAIFAKNS